MSIIKSSIHIASNILRNRYAMVGVAAIIKNKNGQILLGKRSKNIPFYPSMWGLPGGIVEYGETIQQTIKREIKEEIGVEIKVLKYGKPFIHLPNKKCRIHSLNIPAYCKITKGTPKAKDETSEVKWFFKK